MHRFSHNNRFAGARQAARLLLLIAVCVWQSGCKSTLDMSNLKNFGRSNDDEQFASAYDPIYEEDDDRSPLERILQTVGRGREEAARLNYRPAEGIAELEKAQALFDEGKYKEAEKDFKRIAKKYKNSQIEEDALFMRAESQFEQKKYSWAQDGYGTLFEKYPSTRYMNRATQRLFTIARIWLRFPDVVTSGDIQQVDFENPKSTPPPKTKSDKNQSFQLTRAVPILPNAFDRTRPVFDTEGRALQALKSIWLHDPTGPLADDALMMTASYHLRRGDHMEAARVYKILREEYPKSRHLQNAFVLGSHVRLMSYQGEKYDGKALDESRQLVESTLKLFPDAKERQRLEKDLKRIEEKNAARDWETVEFYVGKGNKPRAVAIYCRQIIQDYPNTTYARRARAKLDELRAEARNPGGFGRRVMSVVPGLPRQTTAAPAAVAESPGDIPVITDPGERPREESEPEPGLGQRLMQRLPNVPRLLRVPGGDEPASP